MKFELTSKYDISDTVYFIESNRIRKSKIKCVYLPTIIQTKKGLESFSFKYRLSCNTSLQNGNSQSIPECLLFPNRKELIKTL